MISLHSCHFTQLRFNVSVDLLLLCSLANTTCTIINIMTTLIFIIHHCLSVACVLSCCCSPLIPPLARSSCGNLSFPTFSSTVVVVAPFCYQPANPTEENTSRGSMGSYVSSETTESKPQTNEARTRTK